MTFQTIVLENKYLRATFLPEYGGRLYSLYDKRLCRDLLCVNPVFQPANIAVRNAWFSGGVEWNLGQFGHSEYTCAPVYFARCKNEQGYEFLRMYEYERIKGFYLAIDFHLPPGEQQLFFHVSIYTPQQSHLFYWWTNIAIEQEKEVRVFSGTSGGISEPFRMEGTVSGTPRCPSFLLCPKWMSAFPTAFLFLMNISFRTAPSRGTMGELGESAGRVFL